MFSRFAPRDPTTPEPKASPADHPPLVPAGITLGVAGLIRLVTEPVRSALTGGPEPWYWAALVAGIAVIGFRRRRAGTASQEVAEHGEIV